MITCATLGARGRWMQLHSTCFVKLMENTDSSDLVGSETFTPAPTTPDAWRRCCGGGKLSHQKRARGGAPLVERRIADTTALVIFAVFRLKIPSPTLI
jgi:hypothetical protein